MCLTAFFFTCLACGISGRRVQTVPGSLREVLQKSKQAAGIKQAPVHIPLERLRTFLIAFNSPAGWHRAIGVALNEPMSSALVRRSRSGKQALVIELGKQRAPAPTLRATSEAAPRGEEEKQPREPIRKKQSFGGGSLKRDYSDLFWVEEEEFDPSMWDENGDLINPDTEWEVIEDWKDEYSTYTLTLDDLEGDIDENIPGHRSGFVSILGAPNVGKSTLMNAMLNYSLSITTSKAQTTRHRILGMLNGDDYQIVFQDTPGVLVPQYKLQQNMMQFVKEAFRESDVMVLIVDIFQNSFPDEELLEKMLKSNIAMIVLLNKVDLLDVEGAPDERRAQKAAERRARLGSTEQLLERWREFFPQAKVLPISAKLSGQDVENLKQTLIALLPEHPPWFPKEDMTDQTDRFFAAEMLRQAIFENYYEEVPYACECSVISFKEYEDCNDITMRIFVEQQTQKGILIGKGGVAIDKLVKDATRTMEQFYEKKVNLDVKIKVQSNWRQDDKMLKKFGYIEGD